MVGTAFDSVDIYFVFVCCCFLFSNLDFLDLLNIGRRLLLMFLFSHIDVEYFEEVELGDGVDGE